MKLRTVGIAVVLAAGASGALSLVHPWGNLRAVSATSAPLMAGSNLSPAVEHVIAEKCADCHSNNTRWPAYSRLAPGSWLMEHDVHAARAALNFSNWQQLKPEEQLQLLASISAEVANRRMPVRQYLLLHPSARLTDEERKSVIAWTHDERRRIRSAAQQKKKDTP